MSNYWVFGANQFINSYFAPCRAIKAGSGIFLPLRLAAKPGKEGYSANLSYDDCISFFAEIVYRISFGKMNTLLKMSFNRDGGHNYNFVAKSLEDLYCRNKLKIIKSLITDTSSEKLTNNLPFKVILKLFYCANKLLGKGKIICHVLKRNET